MEGEGWLKIVAVPWGSWKDNYSAVIKLQYKNQTNIIHQIELL